MNSFEKVLFDINEVIRLKVKKNVFGYDVAGVVKGDYFEILLNPNKEIIDINTQYEDRVELMEFIEKQIKEEVESAVFDENGNPLRITYFN